MKLGNIGDWDLSRLEDETLVIGGTDGVVSPSYMAEVDGRDSKLTSSLECILYQQRPEGI